MQGILAVAKKEIKTYFLSPLAYILCGVVLFILGYLFLGAVTFYSLNVPQWSAYGVPINPTRVILKPIFKDMAFLLLFFVPLITMRLIAGEHSHKTLDMLMSSALDEKEIILGKFFAVLFVYVILVASLLYMPVSLSLIGEVDWGLVVAFYLGLLLEGGLFLSFGILSSTLGRSQMTASVLGFGFLLMLWIIGFISQIAGEESWWGNLLTKFSLYYHVDPFFNGVVVLKDVVFFVGFTCVVLYASVFALRSRRWR